MRQILLCAALFISGCFWHSSSPDLYQKDTPVKLTIFWDHKISDSLLERKVWQTDNVEQIMALAKHIDTRNYEPMSLLLNRGMTRIIFSMKSGHIWEFGINRSKKYGDYFPVFDRNDKGWSGKVNLSKSFLSSVNAMIEKEMSIKTNVAIQYSREISEEVLIRVIPERTENIIKQYPGFPEEVWDSKQKKFIWRKS